MKSERQSAPAEMHEGSPSEVVCPKCGERHNLTNMTGAMGTAGLYHCHTCGEQFSVG